MVDRHDYPFFGQTTGMIVSSNSRSEPYMFLKCIKKKQDGSWEKASLGEGKTVKFSLEEMMEIVDLFKGNADKWSGFHDFNGEKTQISINWENGEKKNVWVKINSYARRFQGGQMGVFRDLLAHILDEKIAHATVMSVQRERIKEELTIDSDSSPINTKIKSNNDLVDQNDEKIKVKGKINGQTDKALLIVFLNGQESWIPKSSIASRLEENSDAFQELIVDSWVLKKNKVI
ncbi:MAG: hypothetical protein JW891_06210 [Candidatus Lokiarchaeota archaeon]|nr:hypothetical protein [Candidatus Lokiarchaeota archaeon]